MFAAVGRQEQQPHVWRHGELTGDVPARLVHDHEDELVGMTLGDLSKEHRHHLGVDPGQYETVHHAVVRTDGAEGVQVFAL